MKTLVDSSPTELRIDKPTPNGGAYSIIYYQNADGGSTSKDKALRAEIVEFSSSGKQIFRTYMSLVTKREEAILDD